MLTTGRSKTHSATQLQIVLLSGKGQRLSCVTVLNRFKYVCHCIPRPTFWPQDWVTRRKWSANYRGLSGVKCLFHWRVPIQCGVKLTCSAIKRTKKLELSRFRTGKITLQTRWIGDFGRNQHVWIPICNLSVMAFDWP